MRCHETPLFSLARLIANLSHDTTRVHKGLGHIGRPTRDHQDLGVGLVIDLQSNRLLPLMAREVPSDTPAQTET